MTHYKNATGKNVLTKRLSGIYELIYSPVQQGTGENVTSVSMI